MINVHKDEPLTAKRSDEGRPMSVVLRERLTIASMPFLANDNISMVFKEGDRERLQAEVEEKAEALLQSLVIDTANDHNTRETAKRYAKMLLNEVFGGRYDEQPTVTAFPNHKRLDQMYLVGPIELNSTCSHHLCPILGKAYVGILGGEKVLGLSKFTRLARWFAARPQIQEELTVQIAEHIMEIADARGVAVMIQSSHLCGVIRGIKDKDTQMVTTQLLGEFLDSDSLKAEFYHQVDRTDKK